jgi:Uma2 family endonuclease
MLRPDLALVTAATGKIWLAAEIVDSHDHRPDTVLKKGLYEDFNLPRLWMIDPRYNNIEFYHGTPHGLALKGILAGRERIEEPLLPDFRLTVDELFAV